MQVVLCGSLCIFFCVNNSLFCGPLTGRVPRHSVLELEKKTFYYVGAIIGLSIIHGGPAPQFFSDAVADYIVRGVQHVKATIEDVPEYEIRKSLERVCSSCIVCIM